MHMVIVCGAHSKLVIREAHMVACALSCVSYCQPCTAYPAYLDASDLACMVASDYAFLDDFLHAVQTSC